MITNERDPAKGNGVLIVAIVSLALTVVASMGGWMLSLASRISALEVQSAALSSAPTQLAALEQQIVDFRKDFDELKDEIRNKPGYTYRYPDMSRPAKD
jgi:hypothetical protein